MNQTDSFWLNHTDHDVKSVEFHTYHTTSHCFSRWPIRWIKRQICV